MKGLAIRVIKQIRGDKRSLALIIVAPLFVLTLVYFLLGDSGYIPTIALDTDKYPELTAQLEHEDAMLLNLSETDYTDAEEYLTEHKDVDLIVRRTEAVMDVYLLEQTGKSGKAMEALQNAVQAETKAKQETLRDDLQVLLAAIPSGKLDIPASAELSAHIVYGDENQTMFDSLGFVFLGFFSFFFVFILSGMSLVRERSGGTLERLLMSPIRRKSVILGYTGGFSVFAAIQAVLMVLYAVYVLGIGCAGNILWAIVAILLLAVVAVSFGALISIFAHSEFQVVQFIPIAIIPQVFFSGLIPLDTIPYGLGNLCYLMPVYYGSAAIKGVTVEGAGFGEIWVFLLGLIIYAVVLGVLNTFALKKYRTL